MMRLILLTVLLVIPFGLISSSDAMPARNAQDSGTVVDLAVRSCTAGATFTPTIVHGACETPEPDITITFQDISAGGPKVTDTTDDQGHASISVPDAAHGGTFDVSRKDRVRFLTADYGPDPDSLSLVVDCGTASKGNNFSYAALGFILDTLTPGSTVSCQLSFVPPPPSSRATLSKGTCDHPDETVGELSNVAPRGDQHTGAHIAEPVQTSFTGYRLTLDELTASPHVIVVYDQDKPRTALACGPVGGVPDVDGALAIALPAVGGSRYSGIATLTPNPYGGLDVAVYLGPDLDGSDTSRTTMVDDFRSRLAFPDGGDPDGGGFPIAAYLCDSDPGNYSPYGGPALGGGCEPEAGVRFDATGDDGSSDSCTTDQDGTCAVDVGWGAKITVTEDVSTVPPGYAPRENPVWDTNVTEFRGVRVFNLPIGAPTATPRPTATPTSTPPLRTGGSRTAIFAGTTCDRFDPSQPILELTSLAAPAGTSIGAAVPEPVQESITDSRTTLDTILSGGDRVLVVFDQDDSTVPLACGALAGPLDDRNGTIPDPGALAIALPARNGSLYAGIADLTPTHDGGLRVSVWLARSLSGNG